jgi:DNA-binding XRE family transcriptional regulator
MHPLREYREQQDITQETMGKRLGLSIYAVHRIETCKVRDLSLRLALKIKAETGGKVTPEALAAVH